MQNTELDRQTYNSIDLAKFICSILVVMIHCAPFGSTETVNIITYLNFIIQHYLARIAVPFFFVASGFLLYRKTSVSNFNTEPSQKYIVHIFKLYVIWSLIYFPFAFYNFFKDKKGIVHAILVYTRDIIFTGCGHLWYLNALIVAVIIVAFLLYKKIHPGKIILFAAFLYFIGLFAQSWFGFIVPLRELTPTFWNILKLLKNIIVTTRDGLFEGFFFVSMGMYLAFFNVRIKKKRALIGLGLSMILMLLELFILQYNHYIRAYDMYFFLVPATFFFFCFILQVELPNSAVYKTLRILSALIFYSHPLIKNIVSKVLLITYEPLLESGLPFLLTLFITIIFSLAIIKLSELSKFRWLTNLYS